METRATVHLELNGDLTASDLEEAIRALANARAGMQPEVPRSIEGAALSDSRALVEESPLFTFVTLSDGGLRIHIRSSGLGWLAFNLTAAQRAAVGQLIAGEFAHQHRSQ